LHHVLDETLEQQAHERQKLTADRRPSSAIAKGAASPLKSITPRPRIAGVEHVIWSPPDEKRYARKTHGLKAALR
jgi:hypothetical protein